MGRFVATILSVVETCRQQGQNVLEYLTACCQAALAKAPAPSLLPQPGSG
jgi:transposase